MTPNPTQATGHRWLRAPSEAPRLLRYTGALALVGIALLVRIQIAPAEAGLPFITFFPTTALAAILFGFGPGLLAAGLGSVLAGLWYLPPMTAQSFTLLSQIVFLADALLVCWAADAMHRHRAHYHQALARSEAANVALEREIEVRRQAEEAVREREHSLGEAQQVAHLGSWVMDLTTNQLTWSEEMHHIFGIAPEGFDGTYETFVAALHPDDREAVERAYAESLAEDGRFDIEYRVVHRHSGEIRWCHARCRHDRDATGRVIRSVGTVRDITDQRQGEQAQAITNQKLAAANVELEQFAYVASHDLRQPLRMVSSYLGLIEKRLEPQLTEDTRQFLSFAVDGAKRMDRLILALLEYSRTGKAGVAAPVALATAVNDAMVNLTVAIQDADATIHVAEALPTVTGDPIELSRLFQNLIGNAIKYRAPQRPARIVIGWRRQDGEVVVSVADNGIGIAAEDFERAFGIFQRLVSPEQYEGTGIGLAICKKIVEHHGGRIWIESVVGEGTTFFVALPAGAAPSAKGA